MTDTRAVAYGIEDDGRTGVPLALGTLVLPDFVVLRPGADDPGPRPFPAAVQVAAEGWLRRQGAAAVRGGRLVPYRVRVALGEPEEVTETVDADLYFGTDRGRHWVAAAALDRASGAPLSAVPDWFDPAHPDRRVQLQRLAHTRVDSSIDDVTWAVPPPSPPTTPFRIGDPAGNVEIEVDVDADGGSLSVSVSARVSWCRMLGCPSFCTC